MANKKMVKQWFTYASRDIRAAKALLDLEPEYKSIAAFNCQQCIEKAIKGYLVFHGIRPPKSHAIDYLAKLVMKIDKDLGANLKKAHILTKYAVAYRYPDSAKKPLTTKQAQSSLKLATKLYNILLDEVGK